MAEDKDQNSSRDISDSKDLVSISQAAQILGVSIDTIRRWDKNGSLKSVRPDGKNRYFSVKELEVLKFSQPLTISEASEQLNISPSTLRRLEEKKILVPKRSDSGERVYDKETLQKFLHSSYFLRQKEVEEEILSPLNGKGGGNSGPGNPDDPQKKNIHDVTAHALLGEHHQTISQLEKFRRTLVRAILAIGTVFVGIVAIFTIFFFAYPEGTSKLLGYEKKTPVGKVYVYKQQPSLFARQMRPFSASALRAVEIINRAQREKVAPFPAIDDVNDVFKPDNEGNIASIYTFTVPDTSYLKIPDTGLIQNLNSDYVRGKVPGCEEGDLAIIGACAATTTTIAPAPTSGTTVLTGSFTGSSSGSGDIEAVLAGNGLFGGGTSGEVTLSANLQSGSGLEAIASGLSLTKTCAANEILKWNGVGWACAPDSGGGGNTFETISTTSGTSPVADSATDTLTLQGSNAVTVTGNSATDTIVLDLDVTTTGTTATTSSNSGLEVSSTGLRLLGGCAATQILKWNGANWVCSADSGGGGGGSSVWSDLTDPVANLTLNHNEFTSLFNWNTDDTTSGNFDAFTLTMTNDGASDPNTQRLLVLKNQDDGLINPSTVRTEALLRLEHNDDSTLQKGIEIVGTVSPNGFIDTAIDVSSGPILTALNVGANQIVGTTGDIDMTNFDLFGSLGIIRLQNLATYTGSDQVTVSSGGSGQLILDSSGGQVLFANTDVFNVGGVSLLSYNALSNPGGAATSGLVTDDNDLYIQGALEVDGGFNLAGTFDCIDCLNYDDFSDSLVVDATTTTSLGVNSLIYGVDGAGDFRVDLATGGDLIVRDGASNFATFTDNGSITFATTAGSNFVVNEAAGSNMQILATAATTSDQLVITNTGFGTVTNNTDSFQASIFTATGAGTNNSAIHAVVGNTPADGADTINGVEITGVANTTAGTQNLLRVTPATAGNTAGTLVGLQVDSITTSNTASEIGVRIGSGWDTNLQFADTTAIVQLSNTGTLTFEDDAGNDMLLLQDIGNAANHILTGDADTGLQISGATTDITTAAGEALTIESGTTGSIVIGNDSSNETIQLGTGAANKTVQVGSTTGTSSTLVQSGSNNITFNSQSGAGNVILSDTDTFAIGGVAAGLAYNAISNLGGAASAGNVTDDNDLYIQGALEVDGPVDLAATAGQFNCTDCIDYDDLEDTLNVDANTNTLLGANNLTTTVDGAGVLTVDITGSAGDFLVQDGGVTFVQFEDDGHITLGKAAAAQIIDIGIGTGVDIINIGTGGTGADIIQIGTGAAAKSLTLGTTNTSATTLIQSGSGDITLNADLAAGNVLFADTDTFAIGGVAAGLAYNAISNLGGAANAGNVTDDNDLYVQGALEVDGPLDLAATAGQFNCVDCIDYDDLENTLDVDESTTTNLDANDLIYNLNGAGGIQIDLATGGDFVVRDGVSAFVTFADDGSILLAPTGTANATLTVDSDTALIFSGNTGSTTADIRTGTDEDLTIIPNGIGDVVIDTDSNSQLILNGGGDGVDGLVLTSGDILVTDGDVDISDGDFNVTLDPADSVNVTTATGATVDGLVVAANTATNAVDGLAVSLTTTTGAGALNSAIHAIIANAPVDASDVINGLEVTGVANTVASTTQNLIFVDPAASGNSNGILNGINIDTITTPGAATETAINIGQGWDTGLRIQAQTAFTQTTALVGANFDYVTNFTSATGQNIIGITLDTPALTATTTTTYEGFSFNNPGALAINGGGATFTFNGIDLATPNITQTAGTITSTGLNITLGTITTGGTQTGLRIQGTSTVPTSGTHERLINVVDSSNNNLFELRDMSNANNTFGAAATAGAFISRNSYVGDEFNLYKGTCTGAQTRKRGDWGTAGITGITCADFSGEFSTAGTSVGVGASCTFLSNGDVNGTERISATSAAAAASTSRCLEFMSTDVAATNYNIFDADTNLPVFTTKIRVSQMPVAGTSRIFAGLGDLGSLNTTTSVSPTNGVYFSNCIGVVATPACDNVLKGVARSGGTQVNVTCGTITAGNWMYLRAEVRSATDVHFFWDNNVADGIVEVECGTGLSSGIPTGGLTINYLAGTETNTATPTNLDIDYFRAWQDDNVPTDSGLTGDQAALVAAPTLDPNAQGHTVRLSGDQGRFVVLDHTGAEILGLDIAGNATFAGSLTADALNIQRDDGTQTASIDQEGNVRASQIVGTDIGERYSTNDPSISVGDLVSIDNSIANGAQRTSGAYDGRLLGVVASAPSMVIGIREEVGNEINVAVSGLVPVKISNENGDIKAGDPITASNSPGVGMRASQPGPIVGYAISDFSGESGTVLVRVGSGHSNGDLVGQIQSLADRTTKLESDVVVLQSDGEQVPAASQDIDLSNLNVGSLSVDLDLIVKGAMIVDGPATFKAAVRFQNDVNFEGRATFNNDTGGFALIASGQDKVRVVFDQPYSAPPIISLSLGNGKFAKYSYQNVTAEGFEIVLEEPASADFTFSWIALAVKNAETHLEQP